MARSASAPAGTAVKSQSSVAIGRFLEMMAAERGAAANTLAAYSRDLAAAQEIVGDLVKAEMEGLGSLASAWADLAPSSLSRRCSALRQFFGFCLDEGLRADDPSEVLPKPRMRRPLPRILTTAEVELLFELAEQQASGERPEAVRMLVLLELLYGSGLRASELVGLPLAAVPRDAPLLTITGKGGQQRMVPISGRARTALSRWLALRGGGGRFLFPSRGASGHLTRVRLVPAFARTGGRRRHFARKGVAACAAPRICNAPARRRGRSSRAADAARSCRHCHDANLHAC